MLVNITFFDEFVDEDILRSTVKVDFNVLSKTPVFSSQIRLRKNYGKVYTFDTNDYYSSVTDFCYGMLYNLEISEENFEWFTYILTSKIYKESHITVNTIQTTYSDFLKLKFIIVSKSVNSLCYVADRCDKHDVIYKNRHLTVNFHKKFLLQII